MLSIWISYGSNFNFALASSLILCVFLSLCLFFKLCYSKEHKNNNKCFWILAAWHKRETKVNLGNKVNLIFQCYLILTINKICYLNLSPPLFWMLCAKNTQTNNQENIQLQLSSIVVNYHKITVYNDFIYQCGKGLSLCVHKLKGK